MVPFTRLIMPSCACALTLNTTHKQKSNTLQDREHLLNPKTNACQFWYLWKVYHHGTKGIKTEENFFNNAKFTIISD